MSFADRKLHEFAFPDQAGPPVQSPPCLHVMDIEEARDGGEAKRDC